MTKYDKNRGRCRSALVTMSPRQRLFRETRLCSYLRAQHETTLLRMALTRLKAQAREPGVRVLP